MVRSKTSNSNQSGMASIIITLVLMLVITLIVIGFGVVSRRQTSVTLDNQLSTQAFYSAESGVNDAVAAVAHGYLTANPNGKTSCNSTGGNSLNTSNTTNNSDLDLDATTPGVDSYSCLLINPFPSTLQYESVGLDHSTVLPLEPVTASGFTPDPGGIINISWQESQQAMPSSSTSPVFTSCPGAGAFPQETSWSTNCNAGVIQMDIFPLSIFDGGGNVRSNWVSQVKTVYLEPGGASVVNEAYSSLTEGAVIQTNCTYPSGTNQLSCDFGFVNNSCASYSGTPAPGNYPSCWYMVRLRSYYVPNSVNINSSSGDDFEGAQFVVDSTGKAQDVLKRVVVHVPLGYNFGDQPEYAIQSTKSICKLFGILDPTSAVDTPVWGNPNLNVGSPADLNPSDCTFPIN